MKPNVLQDFEYRYKRIIKELEETRADLICLQEVDHYDDVYKEHLTNMGYQCALVYRKNKDATLIGWQKSKFTLLDQHNVHYNNIADQFGEHSKLFMRSNVALICLLQHVKTGNKLVVAATHLYWKLKKDFVKYAQGVYLLKNISAFLNKHKLSLDDKK